MEKVRSFLVTHLKVIQSYYHRYTILTRLRSSRSVRTPELGHLERGRSRGGSAEADEAARQEPVNFEWRGEEKGRSGGRTLVVP